MAAIRTDTLVICPFCGQQPHNGDLQEHLSAGVSASLGMLSPFESVELHRTACPETRRWWALPEEVAWLTEHGVPTVRREPQDGNPNEPRFQHYFPRWVRWLLEGDHSRPSRKDQSWLIGTSGYACAARNAVKLIQADPGLLLALDSAHRLRGVRGLIYSWLEST